MRSPAFDCAAGRTTILYIFDLRWIGLTSFQHFPGHIHPPTHIVINTTVNLQMRSWVLKAVHLRQALAIDQDTAIRRIGLQVFSFLDVDAEAILAHCIPGLGVPVKLWPVLF